MSVTSMRVPSSNITTISTPCAAFFSVNTASPAVSPAGSGISPGTADAPFCVVITSRLSPSPLIAHLRR